MLENRDRIGRKHGNGVSASRPAAGYELFDLVFFASVHRSGVVRAEIYVQTLYHLLTSFLLLQSHRVPRRFITIT